MASRVEDFRQLVAWLSLPQWADDIVAESDALAWERLRGQRGDKLVLEARAPEVLSSAGIGRLQNFHSEKGLAERLPCNVSQSTPNDRVGIVVV